MSHEPPPPLPGWRDLEALALTNVVVQNAFELMRYGVTPERALLWCVIQLAAHNEKLVEAATDALARRPHAGVANL